MPAVVAWALAGGVFALFYKTGEGVEKAVPFAVAGAAVYLLTRKQMFGALFGHLFGDEQPRSRAPRPAPQPVRNPAGEAAVILALVLFLG